LEAANQLYGEQQCNSHPQNQGISTSILVGKMKGRGKRKVEKKEGRVSE